MVKKLKKVQPSLCDKKEAKQEANGAETKQQQFSTITSPKNSWEHVCHWSHQTFQTDKLSICTQQDDHNEETYSPQLR